MSVAQRPCVKCNNTSTEPCNACGQPICPRHRFGLGSLSDGYSCLSCGGSGFISVATDVEAPALSKLERFANKIPLLCWFLIAVGLGTIAFMLLELLGNS